MREREMAGNGFLRFQLWSWVCCRACTASRGTLSELKAVLNTSLKHPLTSILARGRYLANQPPARYLGLGVVSLPGFCTAPKSLT